MAAARKELGWRIKKKLFQLSGGVPDIQNMRIVLLGAKYEGKSSSGNTILGRNAFDTSGSRECVKGEGEALNRHITLVVAPGWWRDNTLEQTNENDKQEIVLSVSLCPPGPHAILLVLDVSDSFTETHRRAVQGHLQLLGKRVWDHTIVLFTKGDWLGDTTIEQHIESRGDALQWVVEKCGNRYHVVENKKSDADQVLELLVKIEEMVAGNRDRHFDPNEEIMEERMEKKEEELRSEERNMKVKERETLRISTDKRTRQPSYLSIPAPETPLGGIPHISDIRIVLLGYKNGGKTSSGNTILGRKEFGTSGRTAGSVKKEGEKAGRHITVVEAPGWIYKNTVEQTSEHDKQEIVLSLSQCPPGPHAILLVIDVSDSFTETYRRAVQEHLELLGETVWNHTLVLFTKGDWLGHTTIEQHIERGGKALKWVVEKCGNRYHVVENKKSDGGQVTQLLEKIEEMVAGNKGCIIQIPVHQSMDNFPEFKGSVPDDDSSGTSVREHESNDDTGFASAESVGVSGLKKLFEGLKASTPMKQRTSPHGSAQIEEQNFGVEPEKKTTKAKTNYGEQKSSFVDASTITVDHSLFIGRGSYGAVYRGTYQRTPAAVKIVPTGEGLVIKNEFLIPLCLSHPNIVRMMAVAKTETQILIANEYIHGANLQQVLHKDTPIKLWYEDKLFVALDVAMALDYIHEKRIIHQDLKPANIMIAKDNMRAYLTDWGMANYLETMLTSGGGYQRDQVGPRGGTLVYRAPECLVEFEDCSTMSDMWSFGITLLEMFSNSAAWSISTSQELKRLLSKKQTPHGLAKLQPPADAIVKPLLKYEPKSRMQAKDLVILLKSKVDLTKRYGYTW